MTQNNNIMNWLKDYWGWIMLLIIFVSAAGILISLPFLDIRNDNKYCDGNNFVRVNHQKYNCCYEQEYCRSNNMGGCYWYTEEVCNGKEFK